MRRHDEPMNNDEDDRYRVSIAPSQSPGIKGFSSPRRNDLVYIMEMDHMEKMPQESPEVEASGQPSSEDSSRLSSSRATTYSRELLSKFLEQAIAGEAVHSTNGIIQSSLSQPKSSKDQDIRKEKNSRNTSRKKRRDQSNPDTSMAIKEDEWSTYHETNEAIESLLHTPVPSLSTGDSTPQSNNVDTSKLSASTTRQAKRKSHILTSLDAVSVHSDITALTGDFSSTFAETALKNTLIRAGAVRKAQQLAVIDQKLDMLNGILIGEKKVHSKKSVSFGMVHVRDYERILSINPSCTSGPPIGLGWGFAPEQIFDFIVFEAHREKYRRTNRQLLMPRGVRERMLLELGYSENDIIRSVRSSIKSKNQRKQTINNLGAQRIEETLEIAGRKVKDLFIGSK